MSSEEVDKLQSLASLLDAQPPEVQEAFQFLLATAMHEGGNPRFGKFELGNVTGLAVSRRKVTGAEMAYEN